VTSVLWKPLFVAERDAELTAPYRDTAGYGQYGGPYNCLGRRAAWRRIDADRFFADRGYQRMDPPPRSHPFRTFYIVESPPVCPTILNPEPKDVS
jgi:hypothetical protein